MALVGIQGNKRVGAPAGSYLPTYSGTQVAPTYAGVTDYGTLGGIQGTPGVSSPANDYTDQFGNRYRYVDHGGGTGEWMLVTPSGSLVKPSDAGEAADRNAGTSFAGNGSGSTPSYLKGITIGPSGQLQGPGAAQVQAQQAAASYQRGVADPFNSFANDWTSRIGGGINSVNDAMTQQERDQQALNGWAASGLIGQFGQQAGYVNTANQSSQDAYNSFMNSTNPLLTPMTAGGYGDPVQFDPQGLAMQQQAYNWASGVAGGSLDYTAQQASYQGYSAALASVQYAQAQLAALAQYSSDPADVQRQMDGLNQIKQDIQSGGIGQREAIDRIKQELSTGSGRQQAAIDRIIQDIDHGGDDQREVMEKYKALSDPQVTAQERYLAEIARRSFESQDRSNREAVMQDLALRGMRSGGAEISNALAGQERLGQDRTLAELGLQANAVQRSQVAMQGWQQSANSLRAAQQAGIQMYNQAEAQLRAANQSGLGLLASEENALREAQQRGMAMYQDAANQLRAMDDAVGMFNTNEANQNSMFNAQQQNNVSMFNADAYNQNSQFNANAQNNASAFNANAYNQNSMFNAQQQNNAYANNQQTRVAGGVQQGNMANSIRSQNDAINMFNKEQSQITQRFQDTFNQNEAIRVGNVAQGQFNNSQQTTNDIFNRNTGLTNLGIGTIGTLYGMGTNAAAMPVNRAQTNLGNTIAGFGAILPAQTQAGQNAINLWGINTKGKQIVPIGP